MVSVLEEGLEETRRRWRSQSAMVEEDGGDGEAGLPATCSSMQRARASRRSLWSLCFSVTTVLAMTAISGSDESPLGASRMTEIGEEKGQR